MRILPRRSGTFRLWFLLAVVGLLTSLAAMLGCRHQEAQPTASGGAVYYTGPRVKKGGGMAPAVTK